MEKYINSVVNNMNPIGCSFIVNVDKARQDMVIDLFNKKLINYSDSNENYLMIPMNALNLQTKAFNLENAIRNFKKDNFKFSPNEDEKYCMDLRKKIINDNLSKDELIKIKQEIYEIERKRENTDFRYIKYMLLSDMLTHMMILETKKLYPDILNNERLSIDMNNIKQYYSYFQNEKVDIEKLIYEASTPLFDLEILYSYLKSPSRFYVYVLKYGEYICDFLLQEVINNPMCNQRSGVISFNYISADSITHHACGRFFLEETHDITTINGEFIKKSKY
jgi:hypothetical protein